MKECMFCGGSPVTKEHVWPKRLRKIVREHYRNFRHHTQEFMRVDGVLLNGPNNYKERKWGLSSHRLKVVCASCNNGWMSQLQTRVQNWLDPLVRGEWLGLDGTACRALAAWITMHTMVIEAADKNTQATTQQELSQFNQALEALENWSFWMGRYDGCPKLSWRHRAYGLYDPVEADVQWNDYFPVAYMNNKNVQLTAAVTGGLITVSFSSRGTGRALHQKINDIVDSRLRLFCVSGYVDLVSSEAPEKISDSDLDSMMERMSHAYDKLER